MKCPVYALVWPLTGGAGRGGTIAGCTGGCGTGAIMIGLSCAMSKFIIKKEEHFCTKTETFWIYFWYPYSHKYP